MNPQAVYVRAVEVMAQPAFEGSDVSIGVVLILVVLVVGFATDWGKKL